MWKCEGDSLIERAAVRYPEDDNFTPAIIDLISHTPVSHTDSPGAFLTFDLEASGGAGIGGERQNGGNNSILDGAVEALKVTLGT